MEKRGQISTFMIVGLIILLIVGGVFVVNQYVLKSALEREAERASRVPEQVQPVKEHFDSCLKFLTIEALKLAGSQAGYTKMPDDNFPTNPGVPFSSTLEVFSGIEVPYWFYQTSNGIQRKQIPTLPEIQKGIEGYITDNIATCTQRLESFAEEGYAFEVDYDVKSDILIQDEKTISKITLPIKITFKEAIFDLSNYPVVNSIDVPMGRMYKIARGIQNLEDKTNFFEEKTFDAMVAFPEIPLSGTEFTCAKKIWSKQKVIKNMKSIISSNINAIRLKGTYDDANPLHEYFDLDPGIDAGNIKSSFIYSTRWPMIVDVSPAEGDVMKSDPLSQQIPDKVAGIIMSIMCINNWHFVYDVKFPILISLVDPDALDSQGFTFQFADLVIIDNNQPKMNVFGTYDQPELKFPICKYPITNMSVYTFTIDNSGSLIPLEGVGIKYKCITTKCEIGVSGNEAVFEGAFPMCINGLMIGEKQGYYKAEQFASTNEEQAVSLILEQIKTKKLGAKFIEKDDGAIREPYSSEKVLFTLKNKDNDFSASFVYPGTAEIDLIPGTYEVKSYIMGNSTWPITIKGGDIEKCVDTPKNTIWGGIINDRKCFTTKIEDIVVEEVLKGGAEFEWVLTRDDINNKDTITFYTMADHIPGNYESLNLLYSSISQNAKSRYFKEPE